MLDIYFIDYLLVMLFGIFFVSIEAKQLDMKTILRNFFSVLRRFKTASVLNVLGLSIAFVAFMLIMMQVNYDYTFDRSHRNADAIFRVDIVHGSKGSQAIICRPFARAFAGSSPLIEEGCLLSAWTESRFFYIEDGGQRTSYKEDAWNVTPGVLEVFRFDMLEGSERSLDEPNSVVLPESMARKIFGDESAVGKQLISANPMEDAKIVKGVYKDFPRNSALKNVMYTSMSPKENYDNWGNWNYFFFVRLGEGMDKAEVLDNFKRNFNAKEAFGNEFEWGEENSLDLRLTSLPDVHFLNNVDFDSMPKASRQTLLVLFSIAFVILIIAGINFTNFSTALTPMRIKSINTQKVLGCSTGILRAGLIFEAVGLSLIAYLVALVIVHVLSLTSYADLISADMALTANLPLAAYVAAGALLAGLIAAVYGVIAWRRQEGFGMYFTLLGLAVVFLFSGTQVIPTMKNNKRAVTAAWEQAQKDMAGVLPENFPLPAQYAHPVVLDWMIRVLREGRAQNVEEALAVVKADLKAWRWSRRNMTRSWPSSPCSWSAITNKVKLDMDTMETLTYLQGNPLE